MAMTIQCPGGHRLHVRDELAGKKIRCPKCGAIVTAPAPELDAGSASDMEEPAPAKRSVRGEASDLAPSPAVPRVVRSRMTRPPVRARASASGSPWKVPVLVGAGAGLVALAVVGAVMLAGRRGSSPLQATAATSGAPGVLAPAGTSPAEAGRRSPSLPGAATSLPTWIGTDAPFDVGKFLQAPPFDENAAPLYLDALFEFGDELAPCFPVAEAERRSPAARDRQTRFDSIRQAYEQSSASVALDKIDAMLAEFDTGLQKLQAAQQRERCVFEIGLSVDALLPHAQIMRTAARVLAWRAVRDAQTGQHDRAIGPVATALRMSRDVTPRGPLICQLVSMAMEAHTYTSAVIPILSSPGLSVEHCDRLLDVVRQHDAQQRDLLVEGIKGEYVLQRQTLSEFQQRTGVFSPSRLAELEKDQPEPDSLEAMVLRIARDPRLANLPPQQFTTEIEQLNQVYTTVLDVAARPGGERVRALKGIAHRVSASLVKLMLPDFTQAADADQRTKTRRSGMQCLIALRRWQLEHSEPPPDLETIVRSAGLPAVPTDYYVGQPMRMTQIGSEHVIYSVGSDGNDDRALADWEFGQKPGDFIFRLQPAQQ